jgi:hypothetical protein
MQPGLKSWSPARPEIVPIARTDMPGQQTNAGGARSAERKARSGKEWLGVIRRLEPLYTLLPLADGLVRVLSAVIEIGMLAMFHPGEDLPQGDSMALFSRKKTQTDTLQMLILEQAQSIIAAACQKAAAISVAQNITIVYFTRAGTALFQSVGSVRLTGSRARHDGW